MGFVQCEVREDQESINGCAGGASAINTAGGCACGLRTSSVYVWLNELLACLIEL